MPRCILSRTETISMPSLNAGDIQFLNLRNQITPYHAEMHFISHWDNFHAKSQCWRHSSSQLEKPDYSVPCRDAFYLALRQFLYTVIKTETTSSQMKQLSYSNVYDKRFGLKLGRYISDGDKYFTLCHYEIQVASICDNYFFCVWLCLLKFDLKPCLCMHHE
jgi:hypothetical protein